MVRALQLLFGLVLAIGGGWCIWLRKDSPGGVFNVTDTETLWLVALGLVLTLLGLVLFLMGMSPRAKVEQINWRYPDKSPNVDLSGPAFADEDPEPQLQNSDRPSWLQETPGSIDEPSKDQDNTASIAAAGVALVGGATAASAFGASQDSSTQNDEPEYPREELPFERPRFNADGFQKAEDTETVVEATGHATSFAEPNSLQTEIPAETLVETPTNVVQEEQIIEELSADMDSQLNEQDIEAMAMEAANASMDDGFVLESSEPELDTPVLEDNLPTSLPETEIDASDDDAFEAQLNALSDPSTKAAVVSLNDNEDDLVDEETQPSSTNNVTEDLSIESSKLIEEELPSIDISEPDLAPIEAEDLQPEPAVELSLEDDLSLDEIAPNPLEIEIPELEEVGELEPLEDRLPIEEIASTVEEFNTEIENLGSTEELNVTPDETTHSPTAEPSHLEVEIPEVEEVSELEILEEALPTEEVTSTVEEFNAEIEDLGSTDELNLAIEETQSAEENQFEASSSSDDVLSQDDQVESLPDLEFPELDSAAIAETVVTTEQASNTEGIASLEPSSLEEAPQQEKIEDLPELETTPSETRLIDAPLNFKPEDPPSQEDAMELDDKISSEDLSEASLSNELASIDETQLEDLPEELPPLEGASLDEEVSLEENTSKPQEFTKELSTETPEPEAALEVEGLEVIPELDELPTLEPSPINEEADLNILEEVELEPIAPLPEVAIPSEEINIEASLEEQTLPPIEDLPSVDEAPAPPQNSTPIPEVASGMAGLAALAASTASSHNPSSTQMDIQTLADSAMSAPGEGTEVDTLAPPAPITNEQTPSNTNITHPRLLPIKEAIDAGKLEDADNLLADIRRNLVQEGDENTPELAELTALAGDHAAASGRPGGAKWLWRLALQRFGEADAIETNAARAVSERLRQFDH